MARSVRRHGKGLNSFLYRPEYDKRPKDTNQPRLEANDPARYYVTGRGSGDFTVMDAVTGKPVASQFDSREEADGWIYDHCRVAKAA